jgi:GNAT superfamily N-acetyltransferase
MGEIPHIEPARPEDAGQIMEVGRSAMEPHILNITIYGGSGYDRFVHEQIAHRAHGADMVYLVARAEGQPSGCAELRRHPQGLFLNNIVTRREYQSRGIGRQLLKGAAESLGEGLPDAMLLDVFEYNLPARSWYERLGFRQEGWVEWWVLGPPAEAPGLALLVDYPQALVSHREFGFAQFTVATAQGRYPVGCLHQDWFRLSGVAPLGDPALLSLLTRLDPGRRVLALVPAGQLPEAHRLGSHCLIRHCRMVVGLKELLGRLG